MVSIVSSTGAKFRFAFGVYPPTGATRAPRPDNADDLLEGKPEMRALAVSQQMLLEQGTFGALRRRHPQVEIEVLMVSPAVNAGKNWWRWE
jgi:hypothetical protein